MNQKIVFNGVEYTGPDAMPAAVREQYERVLSLLGDEDGNGVPDIGERPADRAQVTARFYSDPAEIPTADRDLFDRARALGGHHINVDRTFTVTYLGGKDGRRIIGSPALRAFIEKAVFIIVLVLLIVFIAVALS